MSKKRDPEQAPEPDFESAIKELESLVEKLESGDLGLADSLTHFEKGVRLSRQCHGLIDRARQAVEVLSSPEDESSARVLPFNESGDDSTKDDEIPF
ncbi:MAG: exodeoxyribonuclease VII small subunit [Wenzhouxiangella sp.]|nr:MAG: exodeoxyribonuclease VII small subunit [Wenzhouxiangella sp.]